jgi:hypothetical protein
MRPLDHWLAATLENGQFHHCLSAIPMVRISPSLTIVPGMSPRSTRVCPAFAAFPGHDRSLLFSRPAFFGSIEAG